MASVQNLIDRIDDPALKDQILSEVNKLSKQKKFGLVFEEHLPECTPLYDVKIKVDSKVALKSGQVSDIYIVRSIYGDKAICEHMIDHKEVALTLNDLVAIAEFGEPIYPYLKPIDSVCNAPDSDLWHTLIEADNYHALQLLEYLYAGKVNCIYIDPPYNSGAKDWKYNNNYVEEKDQYRHSKWLSMMEKRLKLAKKLLNPAESVLIITIDEREYLHLGCLLEEVFSEANMQMVSITINPSGAIRKNLFARADEYAFILLFGEAAVIQPEGAGDETEVRWWYLKRIEDTSSRAHGRPLQFYPIYINESTNSIVKIGDALGKNEDRNNVPHIEGAITVFPIRDDGLEMTWGVTGGTLQRLLDEQVVQVIKSNAPFQPYTIKYLSENYQEKIESGRWAVRGYRSDGSKVVVETGGKLNRATTVWRDKRYDAKTYGTLLMKKFIDKRKFPFPKSLYSVKDSLRYFLRDKKDALVLDFFAGSGTTLQAVNLLNSEDHGKRRCILVTNNEVSAEETESLIKKGLKPSDPEWEKMGIARYITWARTVCSIEGHDVNGKPIEGEYITSKTIKQETERKIVQIKFIKDISKLNKGEKQQLASLLSKENLPKSLVDIETKYIASEEDDHTVSILFDENYADEYIEALDGMQHITEFYIITKNAKIFKNIKEQINEILGNIVVDVPVKMPMADGFKANAAFFKLGFLDKLSVRIGRQFKEMLPTLWMKAGCFGVCPTLAGQRIPEYMVLPENHMAILNDNSCYVHFAEIIENTPEIETVYLVTDSDTDYRSMSKGLNVKYKYQLYRDYLDNFKINSRR